MHDYVNTYERVAELILLSTPCFGLRIDSQDASDLATLYIENRPVAPARALTERMAALPSLDWLPDDDQEVKLTIFRSLVDYLDVQYYVDTFEHDRCPDAALPGVGVTPSALRFCESSRDLLTPARSRPQVTRGNSGNLPVRREYLEDAVLVLGGATVIAGAWILYWQAGLIVAGLVCMLLAVLAYRHRDQHRPHPHSPPSESMGAAAWRLHGRKLKGSNSPEHRGNLPSA